MKNYYLAIDLGASSGRHILGHEVNGEVQLEEVYRFDNAPVEKDGHFYWDIKALEQNILAGLKKCKELGKIPKSVGIDTWGVDYVLLDKNDCVIGDVYCYRDSRMEKTVPQVHEVICQEKLYEKTGIGYNIYNTIYQLYDDVLTKKILNAKTFLMMPDYFHFLLTGFKSNEYTNATTTALVNAKTKDWDREILDILSIPHEIFSKPLQPKTRLGSFSQKIQEIVGYNADVVLPATHDTASAIATLPKGNDYLFLSSGTWSLIGAKRDEPMTDIESMRLGYSNEGGVDCICYLKSIMGLWIMQRAKKETGVDYIAMEKMAEKFYLASSEEYSKSQHFFDVCDKRFYNPKSMVEEINKSFVDRGMPEPKTQDELFYCIHKSLSIAYYDAISEIEELTKNKFDTIYIVGGGSKNEFLSYLTAKILGKNVKFGAKEATALGNLMVQMEVPCGTMKNEK